MEQLSVSSRAASELSLSREETMPSPKRMRADDVGKRHCQIIAKKQN